jgi:hypothetical protein
MADEAHPWMVVEAAAVCLVSGIRMYQPATQATKTTTHGDPILTNRNNPSGLLAKVKTSKPVQVDLASVNNRRKGYQMKGQGHQRDRSSYLTLPQ